MTTQYVSAQQAKEIFGKDVEPNKLLDLNRTLELFDITKPEYIAHFMAQIAHESNGLMWFAELADGSAYEGRKDLGNTVPGYGPKYKGVGPIQVTGYYNYLQFSKFIKDPRVMEGWKYVVDKYPFSISGFWWDTNKINEAIDAGADARRVSRLVNGRDPANGLAERLAYYAKAVKVFPKGSVMPTKDTSKRHYTAKQPTFLKKSEAPASSLPDNQKIAVPAGRLYEVLNAEYDTKTRHTKVELAHGAGTWYLFTAHWKIELATQQAAKRRPVPQHYTQRDSRVEGQAPRSCFSSSNAMLAKHLKPASLSGPNADDEFLRVVRRFGDTTEPAAQLAALRHFGIRAVLEQAGNYEKLQRAIDSIGGASVGYIHRGILSNPTGDGHWIYAFDYTDQDLIVHDPWGVTDLQTGVTIQTNGANISYNKQQFARRWMVSPNGKGGWTYTPNKGWFIYVESVS